MPAVPKKKKYQGTQNNWEWIIKLKLYWLWTQKQVEKSELLIFFFNLPSTCELWRCLLNLHCPHTPTNTSRSFCRLTASKDREEKLKYARDRQNEERQRKIEELRAQAEAAQKYREQKEEERRRRIEEIRVRDTEKRHQVEERKKAIIEAEKERREYILKKNLVSEWVESLSKLSHDSRSLSHSFSHSLYRNANRE